MYSAPMQLLTQGELSCESKEADESAATSDHTYESDELIEDQAKEFEQAMLQPDSSCSLTEPAADQTMEEAAPIHDDELAVTEPEASAATESVSAAAAAADDDPASEVLIAEGARPLLQEKDLQLALYPFLQWLASPCMTSCEALVKQRRVKSMSQLAPIKCSLRFIFALLYESKAIDTIELKALTQLQACQALYQAIVDRQVGSGRTHQLFLLVKKLLVYLSSTKSAKTRQFVQPASFESYLYVENICSESSNQRKQEARDRMVLGISGARGALAAPKEVFQIPKTWSATDSSSTSLPTAAAAVSQCAFKPSTTSPTNSSSDSNQIMTKEELSAVTRACLSYLNSGMKLYESQSTRRPPTAEDDLHFMHHLICATLCLGLAPRSQVLQQLRIGSSLTKEADGLFWIRMRAEQSKNGRATMFALASQLTPAYDIWLQCVRPRLLARSATHGQQLQPHDYVFFKRSGAAPRTDFSSSTCLVTQQVLGRPVNAHTFRSSLITTFYSSGANEAEMSMLASIMAHDPATQRNFYYKPKHQQAAQQASQRMVDQLLPSAGAESASCNFDPEDLELVY